MTDLVTMESRRAELERVADALFEAPTAAIAGARRQIDSAQSLLDRLEEERRSRKASVQPAA